MAGDFALSKVRLNPQQSIQYAAAGVSQQPQLPIRAPQSACNDSDKPPGAFWALAIPAGKPKTRSTPRCVRDSCSGMAEAHWDYSVYNLRLLLLQDSTHSTQDGHLEDRGFYVRQQFDTVLAHLQKGNWPREDSSPVAAEGTPALQVRTSTDYKHRF